MTAALIFMCTVQAGVPFNLVDSSGHHSFRGCLGIGVGVTLGGALTRVSVGSSLAVSLSAVYVSVSVSTSAISTGLAVAQQFVGSTTQKIVAAQEWAKLGTGIVSELSSASLNSVALRG